MKEICLSQALQELDLSNSFNYGYHREVIKILAGETALSRAGYPIISEKSFHLFTTNIPYLFANGLKLVHLVNLYETHIVNLKQLSQKQIESVRRAISVIKTMINTAGVTAPSDLWLLKQLLWSYQKLGLAKLILENDWIDIAALIKQFGFDGNMLMADLNFLCSRGYIKLENNKFKKTAGPQTISVFSPTNTNDKYVDRDWVGHIIAHLQDPTSEIYQHFFTISCTSEKRVSWMATQFEIEIGYRLLPIVLAIKSLGKESDLKKQHLITSTIPNLSSSMLKLLVQAGMIEDDHTVSPLGARVFRRGPGPFGIIHAYNPYMLQHQKILKNQRDGIWVERAANVAASQEANKRSFTMINDSLDLFCKTYNFSYNVFIEHAVGKGEATRQRLQRDGEKKIQYFGADLEDSAIQQAKKAQTQGILPANMRFICHADIGKPEILIQGVEHSGFSTHGSVMVVGNGFHEIRNQSNQSIIDVFRKYCQAGILLIFTEESRLGNSDLLITAWNTYHAGFRYTHEISGQGLRPVYTLKGVENSIFTWEQCASQGGYCVLKQFTTRTRTIYPHPKKDGPNPAISVNYFCLPPQLPPIGEGETIPLFSGR